MLRGSFALCALVSLAVLGACGDDVNETTGIGSTATVRFINATGNQNITVAQNGQVGTGNSALAFGGGSSCLTVDTTDPALVFTDATSGSTLTFNPTFTANSNVTVVAYTDASGNTQFTTLDNAFTPASGQAGLRVFNAADESGNVMLVGTDGTVLNNGAITTFGNAGTFFSIPTGSQTLLFNTGTGTATLATVGPVDINSGTNNTIVIGPAAAGTTTSLRAFLSTGC